MVTDEMVEAFLDATRVEWWRTSGDAEYFRMQARSGLEAALSAAEPVGEVGEMPGSNGGFTMAAFKASDVPIGAKLYTAPPAPPAPSVAVMHPKKVEDLITEVHDAIDEYREGMKGDKFGPHEWPTVDGIKTTIAQSLRRSALSAQVQDARSDDEEETYQIGVRDGYSQAVQEIDRLTGGDGEYRYCTDHDPERHTPGPAEMIQRIVDRFETLNLIGEVEKRGDFWDAPGSAQVQDVAGTETTTRFHIEWIAGARPPVHPNPMTGRTTFESFELAVQHMKSQADDAQFVSLEERRTTIVHIDRSADMRAMLPAAPAKQEGDPNEAN